MDFEKVEALLARYWECETSLEEEQQLREYFRSGDVPDQWKETARLFQYFEEQKAKTVTDITFDSTVIGKLEGNKPRGRMVNLMRNSLRIAAGVAVLLVAGYFVQQEIRKTNDLAETDTYDDPKKAFEETKKALMMISKGFGRAEQQAKKINLFNEAQEKIQTSPVKETEL